MRFVLLPVVRWLLQRRLVLLALYLGWRWMRKTGRVVGLIPKLGTEPLALN